MWPRSAGAVGSKLAACGPPARPRRPRAVRRGGAVARCRQVATDGIGSKDRLKSYCTAGLLCMLLDGASYSVQKSWFNSTTILVTGTYVVRQSRTITDSPAPRARGTAPDLALLRVRLASTSHTPRRPAPSSPRTFGSRRGCRATSGLLPFGPGPFVTPIRRIHQRNVHRVIQLDRDHHSKTH
eukprot:3342895-Pleurochrysis_carterae.AAC.4